ncbi:MAG: hypothetical protein QM528_02685 [Phycisphaerales bacterium]|nr:hypothetical protein [Phycisphaerales bacterium]
MEDFTVIIRNPYKKGILYFTYFLYFINIIGLLIHLTNRAFPLYLIMMGLLTLVSFLVFLFFPKKGLFSFFMIVNLFLWLLLLQWLIVLVLLLLVFFSNKITQDITIIFKKDRLCWYQLFKKEYPYKQLKNLIIRDGILSIDFNNGRFWQFSIETSYTKNEIEHFNKRIHEKIHQI